MRRHPRSHRGRVANALTSRNTKLAWESGQPAVLTANRNKNRVNRNQYPANAEHFLVVISHPDRVAAESFAGVDLAKDEGWC